MQLAKPALGSPLHDQLGCSTRVQQVVLGQRTIFNRNCQGRQCLLQQTAGLVIGGVQGFATAAPALAAAFATNHTSQQLAIIPTGVAAEHLANLKGPETWLTALEVATCSGQQLFMQVVAQMAVISQQGISKGDTPSCCRHQGEAAGLLQSGGTQLAAQTALHLLGRG